MTINKDFSLAKILWYKIGGKAKYLIETENVQDVEKALNFIEKNKIKKVLIIGLGSNLIFLDDYFNGAIIRVVKKEKAKNNDFKIKDEFITLFSGIILDDLIKFSFDNNLIGLEWAGGLPGTVGAGIRGNVGAFGKEIKETLFSVDVLEKKRTGYSLKTLRKSDLNFSYRNSLIKEDKNLIIVSATFKLRISNPDSLKEAKSIYKKNIIYRKKHHPLEYPTCGSVFKNIVKADQIEKIVTAWPDMKKISDSRWHGKVSIGFIIEGLGFSGYKVGNMQVSTKHANFIVNLGSGKARDAIIIIKEIQNKINKIFGFKPEIETEIIGTRQ